MFVLTVDQRRSRSGGDRVPELLAALAATPVLRPFERTAGDEVQAVLVDTVAVVETTLELVRRGHWSTGIGLGTVQRPLPRSTRAGRGPAFEHARAAVEAAKSSPTRVAVRGADPASTGTAAAVLDLLALLVARRTPQGWQAVELVRSGHTQAGAATALGISKQAVSQRLAATGWSVEDAGRAAAATLLLQAGTVP